MSNTFNEIITDVYYKMSQKTTSSTYDLSSVVKPKINSVIRQVCRGEYTSILNPGKTYKAGDLRFMRVKTPINHYVSTDLTAAVVVGDTEISTDTTNYTTTGEIYLKGSVVHYTGKNATQLTGCTNVVVAVDSGDSIRQVVKLPTNADKAFRLFVYNGGKEYEIPYIDNKENASKFCYWTLIQDETSTEQYIDIVNLESDSLIWMYYYKKATELVNNIDECDLPDDYGRDVIGTIVAGELLWDKEQNQIAQTLLTNGYNKLQDMYSYFSQQVKELQPKVLWKKPAMTSLSVELGA